MVVMFGLDQSATVRPSCRICSRHTEVSRPMYAAVYALRSAFRTSTADAPSCRVWYTVYPAPSTTAIEIGPSLERTALRIAFTAVHASSRLTDSWGITRRLPALRDRCAPELRRGW